MNSKRKKVIAITAASALLVSAINSANCYADITKNIIENQSKVTSESLKEYKNPKPKYVEISLGIGKIAGTKDALDGKYHSVYDVSKEDFKPVIDEETYDASYDYYYDKVSKQDLSDNDKEKLRKDTGAEAIILSKMAQSYCENNGPKKDQKLLYEAGFKCGMEDEKSLINGTNSEINGLPKVQNGFTLSEIYKYDDYAYLGYCNGSDYMDKLMSKEKTRTK